MMFFRGAIFFFAIILAVPSWAEGETQDKRYVYCNVFTSAGCFGIAQGDKLTAEVVADFVLYDVDIAGRGHASIYVGFNPKRFINSSKCFQRDFFECSKSVESDGSQRILLRRSTREPYLDITIGANGVPDIIASFVENIRSCERTGQTIRCGP